MSSKILVVLVLVALAVLILWRLSSKSVPPISFNDRAMVLRQGRCTLALPLMRMEKRNLVADALTIDRTFATLYDGGTVVDERIAMPAHYTFGKALSGVISMIFDAQSIEKAAENGKMVLYRIETKDARRFDVLAVFRGKSDLELLYPLNDSLARTIQNCLIGGKKSEGPVVVNRVVEKNDAKLPLTRWSEKLFELDAIINKDM